MTSIPNPAQFALAGNAVFTLQSLKTNARFTYKVRMAEDNLTMHFVSVLIGPDNQNDFRYFGFIRRGVFFHGGPKAKIGVDAPSVKAFRWFWERQANGKPTPQLEVSHMGKCGKCGRPLTVPESIESGFGPECRDKL
ncbi:MAG TPA: DUF6011 domain-containing protein [Roseiarcus sp.]|jgi:hypothetical protein